jgi:carbon-monoxide dehydrogenase medium subunit
MSNLQDFRWAQSVDQALAMVRQGPGRGGFIAGGTNLGMARMVPYDYLVDITGLGLNQIHKDGDMIRIGACATIQELAISPLLQSPRLSFLARAAHSVATKQIRNMATVVGDLVSGYPMADLPAAFLVLEAQLELAGSDRSVVSLREFYDPQCSAGLDGGLVTGIIFQEPPLDSRGWFYKLARTANDVAIMDLACLVRLQQGRFEEVRLGLGSTILSPLRLIEVENFLGGQRAEKQVLSQAAQLSIEGLPVLDNIRGSKAYRIAMIQVLLFRALLECTGRGGEGR